MFFNLLKKMEEEEYEEDEEEEKDNIEEKNKNEINKDDNNNKNEEKIKIKNTKINFKNDNENNKLKDEDISQENKIVNELKITKEKFDKIKNTIFNETLKKFEDLNQKCDLVLTKVNFNKKKKKEEKIKNDNEIIKEKERQIKSDLKMINTLRSDKNKLKGQIETLKKTSSLSEYDALIDKIKLQNFEIEKLKTQNKELEKKYIAVKKENVNYEKKNQQLEDIINRLKGKYNNLKVKKENEQNNSMTDRKKNGSPKTNENRLLNSASEPNFKGLIRCQSMKEILDDNFYHLLTDKERECLKNLFGSNEEYNEFCNKLNIINTRNKRVENQLQSEIARLIKYIRTKERENKNLNEQILLKDEKINNLESKLKIFRKKYNIIVDKHKKILKIKQQLNEKNFNINSMTDKEKLEYLNILVNHFYIEKRKLEEKEKIRKEIGPINFIDDKFFVNLKNKNN